MQPTRPSKLLIILLGGDLLTLILVTIFGFATHGELESAGSRMLTTFIPLALAWLAVAPLMGAFEIDRAVRLSQVWRPFYAMVVAGPLAAWIRGAWLNAPIQPVFVVVLGGISALAILAWRSLFALASRRYNQHG